MRLGRSLILVVAVFAASATVVAALAIDRAAEVSAPADRLVAPDRPPSHALLVSDSAWLGIRTYGAADAVQGFSHVMDLASCRRRVATSCTNYDGFVPITLAAELERRGDEFDSLIVATGYNDSDHNFRDDVAAIVALARERSIERIVWLTLRSNVSYTSPGSAGYAEVFANNNRTLRELVDAGEYPEIVIADWATYARDRPEWFSPDGIHLRRSGPWAAADYISRKMTHLLGEPCAQPASPGAVPADPCPDPDRAGPVDVDAIYPVDATCARGVFVLEWEGSSSWPDPPCWA